GIAGTPGEAPPGLRPLERSRAEGLLHAPADLVQVDADGGQGIAIERRAGAVAPASGRRPQRRRVDAEAGEQPPGRRALVRRQGQQEVLAAQVAVPERQRLLPSALERAPAL